MSDYDYVFRLSPTAGMYTSALRDYFQTNPPKSIAYINVDNAFGEAVYEYGIKKYTDSAGIPFTLEKYKAGELDFKPLMEKIKAANPEVVIVTAGDDNDATQIMKQPKNPACLQRCLSVPARATRSSALRSSPASSPKRY